MLTVNTGVVSIVTMFYCAISDKVHTKRINGLLYVFLSSTGFHYTIWDMNFGEQSRMCTKFTSATQTSQQQISTVSVFATTITL